MNLLRTYRLNRLIQRLCGLRDNAWRMANDPNPYVDFEARQSAADRAWKLNMQANRIDNLKNKRS